MSVTRMHHDELDINKPLVSRLIAEQFPAWVGLPLDPVLSAGTDNALYRLGSDMAVRLPRRMDAALQVEKESLWLPRLAPHLPLAVPVPLALGIPAAGYPFHWSVCRWLSGEDAVSSPVTDLHETAIKVFRGSSLPYRKSTSPAARHRARTISSAVLLWQAGTRRRAQQSKA